MTKAFVKHIHVHVIPGTESAFIKASLVKASKSLEEEGVTGFVLLQRRDDPTRFVISQSFATKGAETAHWATEHYNAWRKATDDFITDARYTEKFLQL
jgi:autoinducer 2-degrading protein